MARGRKRKAGKRHPSGKLVQPRLEETQREVMSTVLEARQRHFGVSERQAKDERLGTALGRLAFVGAITLSQYAAGELYGETMARHRAVVGLPMAQPRSVTGLLINEGIFGGGGYATNAASSASTAVKRVSRQQLCQMRTFVHGFIGRAISIA